METLNQREIDQLLYEINEQAKNISEAKQEVINLSLSTIMNVENPEVREALRKRYALANYMYVEPLETLLSSIIDIGLFKKNTPLYDNMSIREKTIKLSRALANLNMKDNLSAYVPLKDSDADTIAQAKLHGYEDDGTLTSAQRLQASKEYLESLSVDKKEGLKF